MRVVEQRHVIGGEAGPMSNCIHHKVIEQQKEKETKLNTIHYNTTKHNINHHNTTVDEVNKDQMYGYV